MAFIPGGTKELESAKFAQLWNKIITSFRKEDLINDRERDLLLVPYWADRDSGLTQWPPFLFASKIPIAVDMAKDSNGKDLELQKRILGEDYMHFSVQVVNPERCSSFFLSEGFRFSSLLSPVDVSFSFSFFTLSLLSRTSFGIRAEVPP
ncbi:hypothetical protein Taro_005442 [Colocasia esculenta]|uniref:Callose synthase helical domain-containing protein n=1 Tax=Colocasia esculenta TaxID=4460 RepID=A0A843TT43_COLES|nr:hypothetical protein [Colocasia esculenta]